MADGARTDERNANGWTADGPFAEGRWEGVRQAAAAMKPREREGTQRVMSGRGLAATS